MADKNLTLKDFEGKTTIYRSGLKAKVEKYAKIAVSAFALGMLGFGASESEAATVNGFAGVETHGLFSNTVQLVGHWMDDSNGVSAVTQQQLTNAQNNMSRSYAKAMEFIKLETENLNLYQGTIDQNTKVQNELEDKLSDIPQTEEDYQAKALQNVIEKKLKANPYLRSLTREQMADRFSYDVQREMKSLKKRYASGQIALDKQLQQSVQQKNQELIQAGDLSDKLAPVLAIAPEVVADYYQLCAKTANADYRDLRVGRLYDVAEREAQKADAYASIADQAKVCADAQNDVIKKQLQIEMQKERYSRTGDTLLNNTLNAVSLNGVAHLFDFQGRNALNSWGRLQANIGIGDIVSMCQGISSSSTTQMMLGVTSVKVSKQLLAVQALYKMENFNEKGMSLQAVLNPTKNDMQYVNRQVSNAMQSYQNVQGDRRAAKAGLDKWVKYQRLMSIGMGAQQTLEQCSLQMIGNNQNAQQASLKLRTGILSRMVDFAGGTRYQFDNYKGR